MHSAGGSGPGVDVTPDPLPPLLALLPELRALILSRVRDKGACRLACHALRLAANAATQKLSWAWAQETQDAGTDTLPPASLTAALPSLAVLDLSGLTRLSSLQACPTRLRELCCARTRVADLSPLAACTALLALDG